ncbi:hypothetical protein [Robertkochia sediminum]|uniref:hypothetical protein n=1 Tax=Robertkochia sediminum TaxID=2785326 RepID=UPI00193299B9|nr:hypothetical protein [Robertkochia sediminum]MBL7471403.1 hypothetical protein [Robertkochia sediminum]
MSKAKPLTSKEAFFNILKAWSMVMRKDGIEDAEIGQEATGNTAVLWLTLGGKKYYLNGDTRLHGVREFLKNKDNPWVVIPNLNGVRNKVVNTPEHKPVEGFFLYLEH